MDIRVDCINKQPRENTHEAIQFLGGPNPNGVGRWRMSRTEVIKWIRDGHTFYTLDAYGRRANLQIRKSASGNEYVQTVADNAWTNNLLSLPECPS